MTVGKGSAPKGRVISTPVIVGAIIGAVAIGLLAFLVSKGKRSNTDQVHGESMAVSSREGPFRLTVRFNETAYVGDLSITLTQVQQQPDTTNYKVWAKVSIKGQSDMQIRRAEVGSAVTYPEEHGYTIELINAMADLAKFSITKNP